MHDISSSLSRKKFTEIHYHIFVWTLFIVFEITLAGAIRQKFNHFVDYLLHYILNILLFYVHCYFVFGKKQFNSLTDYQNGAFCLILEIACYYLCSLWINMLLLANGIQVDIPDSSSRLFNLSVLYRCLYIIGLSTAFRSVLNLIKNRERIHNYITENLIAEKEKATLRTELVNSELLFLRSQINPHFLFNALNSVYNRIRKNDPNSAEYVMTLADMMKYSLQRQGAEDEVPVEAELEHISNYMELQRMRYAPDIDFRISNDCQGLKIIPLILITLVENVFQHGDLKHPQSPPLIHIRVERDELTLLTRNYIRTDHQSGHGLGNFVAELKNKIMSQKTIKITGWALTIILALLFTMSAYLKLTQNEAAIAMASSIGIDAATYQFIGIIEIISLVLFIIPRTGILGTLLLVAYMGGAIVTHLQHQQPIGMAVTVQIAVWITAFVRFPELKQRLLTPKS